MISARKYQLVQRVLLLGGLFLALYYILVLVPLGDRVNTLDKPLQDAWKKMLKYRLTTATAQGVDLDTLERRLNQLKLTANELEQFTETARNRAALEPAVQAKMRQPFQLVDFQNERQLRLEELERMAKEKKIAVDSGVPYGYPEYSSDLKQPSLLWGHLAAVHQSLLVAIQCQITAINGVSARSPRRIPPDEMQPRIADELPFTLQLTGNMSAVNRFLTTLPLRTAEAQALGLPELPATKPALFIDRVMVRKESPEKPDIVRVELRAVALIYREP